MTFRIGLFLLMKWQKVDRTIGNLAAALDRELPNGDGGISLNPINKKDSRKTVLFLRLKVTLTAKLFYSRTYGAMEPLKNQVREERYSTATVHRLWVAEA
jgi:hypothetical protein